MTAAFFITLREGLEAALIVGIIAAYLIKIGRRDALGKVFIGVAAALTIAVVTGLVVVATIGRLPFEVQEVAEAVAAIAAVVVLTWMLFWMRRQGRAMKGELEQGIDRALTRNTTLAVAGLAFIAVLREGLETVLFLIPIFGALGSNDAAIPASIGAVAGLVVAVGIGVAIFAYGVRIDLRRFFNITGIILIFVAAGLCAYAVHDLVEAGVLPPTQELFDLGAWLPETSFLGALLAGLFGYRSAPTVLEAVAYFGYLVPVLAAFVLGGRPKPTPVVTPATLAAVTLVLGVGAIVAGCGSGATPAPSGPAASPADQLIEVAASEYKYEPSAITATAGAMTFRVTNAGAIEHEFEIFQGETVVDEVEGLVPGLSQDLTVTLAAGEYTFVCKLAGHEEQGMKGTLTVNAA